MLNTAIKILISSPAWMIGLDMLGFDVDWYLGNIGDVLFAFCLGCVVVGVTIGARES